MQLRSCGFAGVALAFLFACSSTQKTSETGATASGSGATTSGSGVGGGGGSDTTGGMAGKGPDVIPPVFVPGDCNLQQPAFCDTFEKEFPGGRAGPLDEKLWSMARWGIPQSGGYRVFARLAAKTPDPGPLNTPTFCNGPFSNVLPPDDLRICDGVDGGGFSSKQLNEVFNDDGSFVYSSLRIRQPFDFADRIGTIVFDVDAKRNIHFDGHGWWTELWLSADPSPMPYHGAPTVEAYARRAVGFQIAPVDNDCFHQESPVCTQVGRVIVEQDYKIVRDAAIEPNNKFINTADGKLNRFKFLVTKDRVEIWASNFDAKGNMVQVAAVENLGLDWTRGYVHFQHAQYNAGKANASPSQSYRWDNVGFDGPTYPTPRGYDVPNQTVMTTSQDGENVLHFGYDLVQQGLPPKRVTAQVTDVDLTNATSASYNFNMYTHGDRAVRYRFNANPWHTYMTPSALSGAFMVRTFSLPAPLEELVAGANTIDMEVDGTPTMDAEGVANMDITVEATP